jgi:hypothetical protein
MDNKADDVESRVSECGRCEMSHSGICLVAAVDAESVDMTVPCDLATRTLTSCLGCPTSLLARAGVGGATNSEGRSLKY